MLRVKSCLMNRNSGSANVEELVATVHDTQFNRYGKLGGPSTAPISLYSERERAQLAVLAGTSRDVFSRMPGKVTDWYARLASRSAALAEMVKATPAETENMDGDLGISDQATYSPRRGISHMYPEIARFSIGPTCSCYCRSCCQNVYLSKPSDGLVSIDDIVSYIANLRASEREALAKGTPVPVLEEALLSGGDPMTLPNTTLIKYMASIAELGLSVIRIGTKELSFHPYRFDDAFFEAIDAFHRQYPLVRLVFMTNFVHPDEFLDVERSGLSEHCSHRCVWLEEVAVPVAKLLCRGHFVSLKNQTPILKRVNDDPTVLRQLQRELSYGGIENQYFFQCRTIVGHQHFAVPVEAALEIIEESQRHLSGLSNRARFVMATTLGKIEVIGACSEAPFASDGAVMFKIVRAPRGHEATQGALVVARENPDALWLNDYLDRIVVDGTGRLSSMAELTR